jgi:flagellar biogenesis protein FliO
MPAYGDVPRDIFSVVLVLVLLGATLWALRRGARSNVPAHLARWRGRPAPGNAKSIETIQRIALTPQHSLHIVRVHGRELIVATHPQGCALLLETSGGSQCP